MKIVTLFILFEKSAKLLKKLPNLKTDPANQ